MEMEKKCLNLKKMLAKNVNFPSQFCIGSISMDLVVLSLEKYL